MSRLVPFGSRVLVTEIIPQDALSARAAAVGISIVVEEQNEPKPTEGIVVAVGDDPFIQERVQVGDHVFFSWRAGIEHFVSGVKYRMLMDNEITAVLKPDDVTSTTSGRQEGSQPEP